MFEIGRDYRITTGIGEDIGYSVFTVEAYEPPLLKLKTQYDETILNTSASYFVKAEKILRNDEIIAAATDFDEFVEFEK